ncbi:ATP-binding cassette glutathione S-conjugate transporter ycf1 [Blastocladiella emersonii ATCC 22665]|nr:ATP-binding cassette glutathione S-conjugate transporter ycf1 [Blastocladiella emersonii ATCC 22665]
MQSTGVARVPAFDRWCAANGGFGPLLPAALPDSPAWDLTPCFQRSVVDSAPLAVLLVFGALRLWRLARVPAAATAPAAGLHLWAKQTVIFAIAALEYAEYFARPAHASFDLVLVVAHVALLAGGWTLSLLEHTRSRASSDTLLVTWLLLAIASAFAIKTYLVSHDLDLVLYLRAASAALAVVAFLLELATKRRPGYHLLADAEAEGPAAVAHHGTASAEDGEDNDDDDDDDSLASPEETANIFSRLSFWWLTALMQKGRRQVLVHDDLWKVPATESTNYNHSRFEANWNRELHAHAGQQPSLLRVLVQTFGPAFALAALLKFAQDSLAFLQPQLLQRLINHKSPGEGGLIAVGMLLTAFAQSMFINQYFQLCMVLGMRIRTALSSAIYHKALKLSLSAKGTHSTGQLTTYMSVDAQKLNDLCTYLHIVWSGPFQIALALYFLWAQLGPAVLAGLFVMIIMIPFNAKFVKRQQAIQKDQMRCKDSRLRLMDELLSGIKVVKLYAWELFFLNKIDNVRQRELRNLKKYGWLSAATGFSWMCTPFLVAFVSFSVHTLVQKEPLTPTKAFVSLSLFNLLQFPLTMFPNVINSCVEASVSLNRIHAFLTMEEVHNEYLVRKPKPAAASSTVNSVGIRIKGNFAWSATATANPTLKDLDLTFLSRDLVCVVGKVGSGKSSLLSAVLGEMEAVGSGDSFVEITGTVAYVSDQSWILNDTIRANITFGLPLDEEWYAQVLRATCLDLDLATFPDGDLCLVGEKGITCSGGQAKRITIARAVYAARDVYLLDAPLGALDSHVGRLVFDQCFGPNGLLKGKCRILVTHQTHLMNRCDIVVYMKDGRVTEMGNFTHVTSLKGDVCQMLSAVTVPSASGNGAAGSSSSASSGTGELTVAAQSTGKSKEESAAAAAPTHSLINKGTGNQMTVETVATGSVSWHVYKLYLRSCTWRGVALLVLSSIATQALNMSSNIWLQYSVSHTVEPATFLSVYGAIGLGFALAGVTTTLTAWVVCGIRAAHTLHNTMLSRVAAYPMSFFDTQPTGRVLNRFSKDINVIDEVLPRSFMQMLRTFLTVISVIVLISSYTPSFLAIISPLMVAYYAIQRYYLSTSRELKRLESTSRSPGISHFSESLDGIHVIRAYQQESRFIRECHTRLDHNLKAYYLSVSSNRWLAVRLEFLGAIVVFSTAMLMVHTGADSSVIGLTMSYALTTTGALNWMVRQYCEVETNVVSVERVHEYCELEVEAPSLMPSRPSPLWPERGEIVFDHYSTRYREGLSLVLKDVNIKINPREKIGIVGRTGSGKSSTLLSLFRIIEPAEGRIFIDGQDISTIGLFDLRSRLTIIPQDAVLFSGTVRQNLDPFQQHDDAALWQALDSVQLRQHVAQLPDKLSHCISHGSTFSLGQRQLICLARALLRNTQILFLDEATAQIDVETDRIIQHTIRTQFSHCTILTIAHRINTVYDSSDRILCLNYGEVVEFDTPQALMAQPDSIFRSLVEESGLH